MTSPSPAIAAGERQAARRKGVALGLRSAIAWICLGLAYVVALSFYKSTTMDELASQALQSLKTGRHAKVTSLFQASFYFFYDEQFLSGHRKHAGRARVSAAWSGSRSSPTRGARSSSIRPTQKPDEKSSRPPRVSMTSP